MTFYTTEMYNNFPQDIDPNRLLYYRNV